MVLSFETIKKPGKFINLNKKIIFDSVDIFKRMNHFYLLLLFLYCFVICGMNCVLLNQPNLTFCS